LCEVRHDRGAGLVNAATMTEGLRERHRKQLLIFTVCSQALIQLLLFLCSHLPLFDSSPWTVLEKSTTAWTTSSLLRWDVFHFGLVAEERMYEHQWAFFPGVPAFLNLLRRIAPNDHWATLLQVGIMLAIAGDSTLVLYELSLRHLKSPSLSFLSTTLSLLPSSPATLRHAAYAEPFFTWASYRGCIRSQLHFTRTQRPPRNVSMRRVTLGISFGLFLPRGGLPFERHSTLWICPLGDAR
jgi:phosphatidylinositol glycan class V